VTDPQWDSYPGMQRFRAFLEKHYPEEPRNDVQRDSGGVENGMAANPSGRLRNCERAGLSQPKSIRRR
jgi:hypothetical protein